MKKLILIGLIICLFLISGCGEQVESSDQTESSANIEKISVKGMSGMELVISPVEGKTVKGIITVEVKDVPEAAGVAGFFMYPQGKQMSDGPILGLDTDGRDGWSAIVDTSKHDNGVWELGVAVGEQIGEDKDPLGAVSTQMIIEN